MGALWHGAGRPRQLSLAAAARVAAVALLVTAGTACIPFIIKYGPTLQADGWSIQLEFLKDGPNSVQTAGDTVAVPANGERFIWAFVTIRNNTAQPRVFGYDACDLDLGGDVLVPSVIGKFPFPLSERNETFRPGESLDRRLIFSYPEGRLPTRLQCGPHISFAIPQTRK